MGSKRSRPRHFTHSKRKTTTSKRKSVTRNSSRLRMADAVRDAEHIRTTKTAEQLDVSPTQAVREQCDGVSVTTLRYIRKHLELIQSTAIVVANALREQNVELDAANVLRRYVSDELQEQIEGIDSLLGWVKS